MTKVAVRVPSVSSAIRKPRFGGLTGSAEASWSRSLVITRSGCADHCRKADRNRPELPDFGLLGLTYPIGRADGFDKGEQGRAGERSERLGVAVGESI